MAGLDIRSLDIAMLRTFDALLTERSVSRAAARLFLSQPAVSASLKRLRETFGDPLFTRSAHGVVPTARALALAPHVQAVLAEVQRLLTAGHEFDPAASERIFRIVGSDHMSELLLPPVCAQLVESGSRIRLFWESANYAALPERLQRGEVDFGLLPRVNPPTGLASELLYEDHYVLVTRRGHPRFVDGVTLADFCAAPQVFLGYGRSALDDLIDQLVGRAGQRRYTQVAVTSFAQMAQLLQATDHVAVFPARVAARYQDTLASHPLPFDMPRYGMYLCWNERAGDDPAVQWMRGRLLAAGRRQGVTLPSASA